MLFSTATVRKFLWIGPLLVLLTAVFLQTTTEAKLSTPGAESSTNSELQRTELPGPTAEPLFSSGRVASGAALASHPINAWVGAAPGGLTSTVGRTVTVVGTSFTAGQSSSVSLDMVSQGDENALGFSITFDTSKLTYVSAVKGSGATSATLNINTLQLAAGHLGFALSQSTGVTFTAGNTPLVVVTFAANVNGTGTTDIGFGDAPIAREVADVDANVLATTYVPATLPINPPPNPVPGLSLISPTSVVAGGSSFVLSLTGSNFINTSVVRIDSTDLTTSFVDSTHLTAQVTAAAIATAKNANITVFNPLPGGGSSSAVTLAINNPTPGLTSITPTTAIAGSGAMVLTVNGTGFINGSVVRFAGNNRTTTFSSTTQLTANLTAADVGTAGTYPITVQTAGPGGGTTSAVNLTINNPVPTVTTLNPASVSAGSAAFSLTVNGTNFVNGSTVKLGGASRTTSFVSNTQLTASLTAADVAAAATLAITVENLAPGGGVSNSVNLPVTNPTPGVTSISPNSVTVGGAAFSLTVNGTGFVNGSVVKLAGSNRTTSFVDNTKLTANITAADIQNTGTLAVTVFNPAPGGGTSGGQDLAIVNPAAILTSISPTTKTVGSAAFTLTATGSNFVNGAIIRLNGGDRTTAFVNSTQLTTQVSAADVQAAGTIVVTVFNPAPGGGASDPVNLSVNNGEPAVTTLNPLNVIAGAAPFTLTVNGSNFVNGSTVKLNTLARPTTFVNSTQLTADIGADDVALAATLAVTVENPAPGGGLSAPATLTVSNPLPAVTSIAPSSLNMGGPAFSLTVNGTGFVSGSVVKFAGSDRTTSFVDSTKLTASISAADIQNIGTFAITVFSAAPGGGTSGAQNLAVVNPSANIVSILPTNKTVGDADFTLTVTGANFVNGAVIRFNGTDRVTAFVNATQLTTQVAAADIQTAGVVAVTVFNPAPGGGSTGSVDLTIGNALPSVVSLNPASVTAGAAAFSLTVDGTNFVNGSTVKLNGAARPTQFVNGTELTADIGAADVATAGTLSITVESPAPGGGASTSAPLIVNNPIPSITALLPDTVSAGDAAFTLSLTGGNFVSSSVVRLNGSNRPTTFVDATHLTAQVGAIDISSAGPVAVTVFNPTPGGGLATSLDLTVNPPASGTRTIRVVNATTIPSNTVNVSFEILSQGDENSWGFSVLYDPTQLTFVTAAKGVDVPTSTLVFNGGAAIGHVGIAGTLPAGTTLTAGVRQLVTLTFLTASSNNLDSTEVRFDDFPIAREVVDVAASPLSTAYSLGVVTIAHGFEGDVSPPPNGSTDGKVTVQDWSQIGRFMALLDSVTQGSEFQRADCAPIQTRGDGRLTVADWAQAGRYAAQLDPVPFAGGPLTSTPLAVNRSSRAARDSQALADETKVVIADRGSNPGQYSISINLDSKGIENALGFSLMFDTSRLRFVKAQKGSGSSDAALQVNATEVKKGRLGFAVALPADRAYPSGTQEVLVVTFEALQGAAEINVPEFSDLPIQREVVDSKAQTIDASFVGRNIGNPIDEAQYFVQQHYLDFLARNADRGGLDYWTEQISGCGPDAACVQHRRVDVSAAFFVEREFQQTGFFIERLYKVILGRQPSYAEFDRDHGTMAAIRESEAARSNLIDTWLNRSEFLNRYPQSLGNEQFVDVMLANLKQGSGLDLKGARTELIASHDRASIIRSLVENSELVRAEYNPSFVLSEYFGYLRRDPERAGYEFWLSVLNDRTPNNYHSMVCAFVTSEEYQKRFGSIATHSNSDCSR